MTSFVRKHPIGTGAGVAVVVAGLAWLAFGFFGVHTLFIDDVVDEAGPVFDAAPAAADEVPAAAPNAEETAVESAPEVVAELAGTFESGAHPTSGIATVLGNGTGQRFLRFENFETDNGPDLNVYLVNSSTGDVSDYIDLGDLKGNIGDQNYEIPADVDLSVYDEVVIWCVRFGVGFGDATLMAV